MTRVCLFPSRAKRPEIVAKVHRDTSELSRMKGLEPRLGFAAKFPTLLHPLLFLPSLLCRPYIPLAICRPRKATVMMRYRLHPGSVRRNCRSLLRSVSGRNFKSACVTSRCSSLLSAAPDPLRNPSAFFAYSGGCSAPSSAYPCGSSLLVCLDVTVAAAVRNSTCDSVGDRKKSIESAVCSGSNWVLTAGQARLFRVSNASWLDDLLQYYLSKIEACYSAILHAYQPIV